MRNLYIFDKRTQTGRYHHRTNTMRHKYRAPIEEYREAIPQKWWQRLLRRPVAYRLRIRRQTIPQHINCRCAINLNLEVAHGT